MSKFTKGLALTAGLVVLAAAALNAFVGFSPAVPANADTLQGSNPDVIVGSIYELRKWTTATINGQHSYSIGTESCNIGNVPLLWQANNPNHPVIGQNFYRLKNNRFEMIGMSWLKHGFAALNGSLCGTCISTPSDTLGVGCSDPYSAGLNGSQSNLGPRYEVNPYTGVFPYPFGGGGVSNALDKRIIVNFSDVDPAQNAGALYFAEGHYVTADDAQAGNGTNNASYRRIQFSGTGSASFVSGQTTQRQQPAIFAWVANDPTVVLSKVDLSTDNDGVFYLASRTEDLGNGTWLYEYALQNLNVHRAIRAFGVPIPNGVNLTQIGSSIPEYQPLDPYANNAWKTKMKIGHRVWATKSFTQNPNANAIYWGTIFNFRFVADSPPASVQVGVELFRPGTPKRVFFAGVGPS